MMLKRNRSSRKTVSGNDFTGRKLLPSEVPPVVNAAPWNTGTLIFRVDKAATTSVSMSTLRPIAKAQFGFNNITDAGTSTVHFEFRIQSVSCWAITGSTLSLYPIDLVRGTNSGSQVELARLDSIAMRNMYARTGFSFPGAIRAIPLSTDRDGGQKIFVVKSDGSIEAHIHVLWRGANTAELQRTYDFVRPDGISGVHGSVSELSFQVVEDTNPRLAQLEHMMAKLLDRLDQSTGS